MMQLQMNERAWVFGERHQVIDLLRKQRESGGPFSVQPEAVHALVQEIDLLQVVAHAAENVATFPAGETAAETFTYVRNALRRWKE